MFYISHEKRIFHSPLVKDCKMLAQTAFEQWRIFIVPHFLGQGTLVFEVKSEELPNAVALHEKQYRGNDPNKMGFEEKIEHKETLSLYLNVFYVCSLPRQVTTTLTNAFQRVYVNVMGPSDKTILLKYSVGMVRWRTLDFQWP